MTSSAVEVRGLAPGLAHQELHDLFATVGPLVHVVTSWSRDGKSMSAIVVYETPAAAAQALQYLQGYSLQAPFRLQLQPSSQVAGSLVALSQQFLGVDEGIAPGGILGYGEQATGLEAGLAALHLGQQLQAEQLGTNGTGGQPLDGTSPAMFSHHAELTGWPMGVVGGLGIQGMGPAALMQAAALDQQQRGLGWPAGRGPRGMGPPGRPLGKEGASKEPTVKLWLGGVDGSADLEIVEQIFGKYGPVIDKELQQARHERGRTDQWGFVVFKNVADAKAAYEDLCGNVVPGLTGTRRLKLQYRNPDPRRSRNILVSTA